MIPNTLSSTATATASPAQANVGSSSSADVGCNQCNKILKESNLSFIFGIASLILEGRNHASSDESFGRSSITSTSNLSHSAHHSRNNTDDEISYFCSNRFKNPFYQSHTSPGAASATSTSAKLNTLLQQKSDNIMSPTSSFDFASHCYDLPQMKLSPKCFKRDFRFESPNQTFIFFNRSSQRIPDTFGNSRKLSSSSSSSSSTTTNTSSSSPQNGPHCDQFLRRIGLHKNENAEFEEHCCDMSVINLMCTRWRTYCSRIKTIISFGEPVCIEVYLGPAAHKILLEQWIININEQSLSPSMTLLSLCSAIRSQLYFSQISAWSELIKKSDSSVEDSGRIIYSSTTNRAAGDLIEISTNSFLNSSICETPNSSRMMNMRRNRNLPSSSNSSFGGGSGGGIGVGNNSSSNICNSNSSPRLNIFYTIKKYDSTASFLSKPNVHTFPSVNIEDNLSLTVCLKSLPRLNGGIPKIGQIFNSPPHDSFPSSSTSSTLSSSNINNSPGISNSNNSSNISSSSSSGNGSDNISNNDRSNNHNSGNDNGSGNNGSNRNGCGGAKVSAISPNNKVQPMQFENFNDGDRKKSDNIVVAPQMNSCDKNDIRKLINNSKNMNNSSNGSSSSNANNYDAHSNLVSIGSSNGSCSSNSMLQRPDSLDLKSKNYEHSLKGTHVNNVEPSGSKNSSLKNQMIKEHANSSAATSTASKSSVVKSNFCENFDNNADMSDDKDSNNSFTSDSLSHREKQLQKYRKRILKRDKKVRDNCSNDKNGGLSSCDSTISYVEKVSIGTQTSQDYCMNCGGEKSFICMNCHCGSTKNSDGSCSEHDEVDYSKQSTSTNSGTTNIENTKQSKGDLLLESIQRTPRVANLKKKSPLKDTMFDLTNQKLNNNHSSNNSNNSYSSNNGSMSSCQVCKRQKTDHIFTKDPNNDCDSSLDSRPQTTATLYNSSSKIDGHFKDLDKHKLNKDSMLSGHDYERNTSNENSDGPSPSFSSSSNKTPSSSSSLLEIFLDFRHQQQQQNPQNHLQQHQSNQKQMQHPQQQQKNEKQKDFEEIFKNNFLFSKEEEQFRTPTEEDNLIKKQQKYNQSMATARTTNAMSDDVSSTSGATTSKCKSSTKSKEPPTTLESLHNIKTNFTIDFRKACNGANNNNNSSHNNNNNITPRDSSLESKLKGKILPRINLTEIFCKPSMTMPIADNVVFTAPLKLNEKNLNINDGFLFGTPCNNVPVQKSLSAPSIVNPLLLSPRATNVMPTFKQRSRHLSDRSERSSFGSDEQFSDEDFESSSMSCSSPCYTKNKARMFQSFQRLSMLGNLEESLLQKRLLPKMKVLGFKVLLGASGGFCPTQLTIPATAYFYEFNDDIMSTPYFCEVNLPRKGYTVPRFGTVQVTLLNPLGTVVRMFVVPYDLRDMPPWHCTFVRQRILAEANTTSSNKSPIPNGSYNSNCNSSNNNNNNHNNNNNNNFNKMDNNSMDQNQTNGDDSIESTDCNKAATSISSHSTSSSSLMMSPTAILNKSSKENLSHFITPDQMKRLRYCIHLKFQTSRSGRLSLCKDIRLLVSRRTDCDTAAAHAKGTLESPNDFVIYTCTPHNPVYSSRQENPSKL